MSFPNKYLAYCTKCKRPVAPGSGETTMGPRGWETTHSEECYPKLETFEPYMEMRERGEYDGMTEADWMEACNPNEGSK